MKQSETQIKYPGNDQMLVNPYTEADTPVRTNTYSFMDKHIFYKLFWLFILGSIFGCYMEQVQYYLHRGIWESRAGVVWGPFSEIYGLGTVIIYLLSNLMQNSSPLTIFFISAISGSAFEYLSRLFQEICFGSITWDYSKEAFNLGGRTSLKYGIYWGLLGLLFIKFVFPQCHKLLGLIHGRFAFTFTWLLIVFMALNLSTSALAVNRWNERMSDVASDSKLDDYLDANYSNEKMDYIYPHLRFIGNSVNES